MNHHETNRKPPNADGDGANLPDEFGDHGADVRNVDPESIVSHEESMRALESQVEEWKGKHQRALADYQNLSRRSRDNESDALRQGVREVAGAMVTVLDHFEMALNQDLSKASPEQVKAGVAVIRDEIVKTLSRFGLVVIHPKPGEEFDPMRHEAVMQATGPDGMKSGHVVQVFQAGYALAERTLRPAKVSVSV